MPRRKGHGIPPTKRVKHIDAITRSAPLKNKLYNDIPFVNSKEEPIQMTVNTVAIKSEPPSIISDALHSKYLHKKFKKMASTLLSEETNNQLNNVLNGRNLKNNSRVTSSPEYSSDYDKVRSSQTSSPKSEASLNNHRVISPPAGRYVCSYCKLACAKPSVLQKHIRAHTNERPYPCLPCGFAFKTKSNLYKHCRSRAHASKMEERGEKMTELVAFEGEDVGSSEDDEGSRSGAQNLSLTEFKSEMDLDRDDMPKSIYKPKYRFMEQPLKSEMSDERKENNNSPPRLHLKIPVPNTTPSVSTPSPFTSGSSPSPEFIHRHISKLISENQAIVETNDPFWTKKFMQRTNSTENSCSSPLSTSPSPSENFIKKSSKQSIGLDSPEDLNCDKQSPKHSKLALALLRPQGSVSPKFTNSSAESCDPQPLNLSTTNKEQDPVNHSRKRSYSECVPERSPKLVKDKVNSVPLKLHNHAVQDFRRFASTLSETSASMLLNHLDVKKELIGSIQNPEGSIIKDILLKARASASSAFIKGEATPNNKSVLPLSPPIPEERAFSPSSQFMCHLCKDYVTADSLEIHQLYHCKSSESLSQSFLNNLTSCIEGRQADLMSYLKPGSKEGSLITAPSYPSPGPLLGSTPLIESYTTKTPLSPDLTHTMLKKRKFDAVTAEKRIISATTLRSLEELSKSPMCSNLQMFGGEVKILDNSNGESKTLRIEPSNRNSPKTPSDLSIVSSQQRRTVLKDENDLQKTSSNNMVVTIAKQGLNSGGAIVQVPQNTLKEQLSPRQLSNSKNVIPASSTSRLSSFQESNKTPNVAPNISGTGISTSVQIPFIPFSSILPESTINPLTNITAYNPLTLPPATMLQPKPTGIPSMYSPVIPSGIATILHGGKEIPYVPGMPGPHSLLANHSAPVLSTKVESNKQLKPSETKAHIQQEQVRNGKVDSLLPIKKKPNSLNIPTIQVNSEKIPSPVEGIQSVQRKRSFEESIGLTTEATTSKANTPKLNQPFSLPLESEDGAENHLEQKFLRPTSLPLKPGTFVPKRQQSTPVLSLVSPETPRPRKSYGQLYLNGHAYTYLGLKCSTRMFFCTLNKPQPIYVPLSPEHNKVSMYSNWKVFTEADPNPCGLDPGQAMALYDSRHRPNMYTLAQTRNCEAVTHSTYWTSRTLLNNKHEKEESSETIPKRVKIFAGGFESNEDYIYVRGRGRGRYVCEECGIRCKKPSMLKKHIRTHTDVRPFTCVHCRFSFKTKGNLTKHMKSKAHYKRCVSLGINPVPTVVDDSNVDEAALARQQALRETRGSDAGESEEEEEEDEDETEDEEDDEEDEGEGDGEEEEDMQSYVEREAARSLLTLSETIQSATQRQYGLVAVCARPNTYPYSFTQVTDSTTLPQTPTLTSISAQREREKVSQNTGLARDVQVDLKPKTSVEESKVDAAEKNVTARNYFPSSRDLGNSAEESPEAPKQSTPMDLSNKATDKASPRVCEAAMLLATLCSTMERLPIPTTSSAVNEDSALLQAYLTERAVQDTRIKQQQYKHKTSTIELADHRVKSASSTVSVPDIAAAKENALGILAQTSSDARKLPASEPSTNNRPQAEFLPPSSGPSPSYVSVLEDGRSMCNICNKVFSKPSQLRLHVNIHYFERPFRCESCAVSFRTKGHLQKHQRSVSHLNKVNMNSTFGTATTTNPRPFKCDDCKIAFRIHGHLAKHLRSKMHIMKLECLGKLPFGTYAELERSGVNMNDIDTTDCENSLESLQLLAQKLYEKDPSKLGQWDPIEMMPHPGHSSGDTSSEGEDEDMPAEQMIPPPTPHVQRLPPPPPPVTATTNYKGPRHKMADTEDSRATTELTKSTSDRRTDETSES